MQTQVQPTLQRQTLYPKLNQTRLERWVYSQESSVPSQRTRVQFPIPTSGSQQQPVAPAPVYLSPSAGHQRHHTSHTLTQTHVRTHKKTYFFLLKGDKTNKTNNGEKQKKIWASRQYFQSSSHLMLEVRNHTLKRQFISLKFPGSIQVFFLSNKGWGRNW